MAVFPTASGRPPCQSSPTRIAAEQAVGKFQNRRFPSRRPPCRTARRSAPSQAGGTARSPRQGWPASPGCSAVAPHRGAAGCAAPRVLPQFGLTGDTSFSADAWGAANVTFPGTQLDPLREASIPRRYFSILVPDRNVGLVRRKNYVMSLRTSPIDVYDEFVATFGGDPIVAVFDTPLGRSALK